MNLKEAEILIEKFIHHQLTREEADELLQWLEKDNNEEVFNNHIGINYLLRNKVLDFDSTEAYAKIQKFLKPKKNKKPEWIAILKYAAIFIGIIGVGFYFLKPGSSGNNQELVPNYVTLEMENGKIEKINSEDQKSLYNNEGQLIGTKKKNSLNYETDSPIKNLVYNTLRIPNGKIFELILSDGSQVILNSGTTITYPVHFLPNKKRTVYLAGEAFFKVAKDSLNQFVVNTKNQKVVVYGTRFNVSAYTNGQFTKTILIEGSVGVSKGKFDVRLNPGEMAISTKEDNIIELKEVNPLDYIGWTQGELIFVREPFEEIIKTLERKFDVKIKNNYKDLNEQVFTASFEDKSIEEILNLFAKSRNFEFSREGNIITLTE